MSANRKGRADEHRNAGSTLLSEAREVELARRMIRCGARLQVLVAETSLSYERLSRLYHELRGKSPSKGMLPFSETWYLGWKANLHASFFYSFYESLERNTPDMRGIDRLITAYEHYEDSPLAMDDRNSPKPVLSFTRAWMLARFVKRARTLRMDTCAGCGIGFLAMNTGASASASRYCAVCHPPPRALPALRAGSIDRQGTGAAGTRPYSAPEGLSAEGVS
ncbi:MAG: transcriptional regulator FlhC [Candidimonas sp.]|nr:MAG: transcriptional regulator FlhC [Candidimonas sp.]